jgi:uncharacterized protein
MPPSLPADERRRDIVRRTEQFARRELADDPTGHDWWHADRVRRTALRIAEQEGADTFIVELASLLHDVADFKFSGSEEAGPDQAWKWLASLGVSESIREAVVEIIRRMSFKGACVVESSLSLEGKCVQDADRLDALGAIGIARTFAYGGFVNRPIHDPSVEPTLHMSAEAYRRTRGTTINHFHEKLLLLRSRMKTDTGRAMATSRHQVLVDFLSEFEAEWSGDEPFPRPDEAAAPATGMMDRRWRRSIGTRSTRGWWRSGARSAFARRRTG